MSDSGMLSWICLWRGNIVQKRLTSVSILIVIMLLGLVSASQASKCQYPFAMEIVSSTPVVDDSAEDILGAPDGVAPDFDNRGRTPSTVVVAFASHIINREGNDFSVTYWDLPETQRQETSEVLVKGSGYDFTRIGIIEPTPGLTVRRITQVAFFDLDDLGWDEVEQVMIRNLEAKPDTKHEGLDIDGFTAIHCADGDTLPSDAIALKASGLRGTKATCWNTTNDDLTLARHDDKGRITCAHLFTHPGDSIHISIYGHSDVKQ